MLRTLKQYKCVVKGAEVSFIRMLWQREHVGFGSEKLPGRIRSMEGEKGTKNMERLKAARGVGRDEMTTRINRY